MASTILSTAVVLLQIIKLSLSQHVSYDGTNFTSESLLWGLDTSEATEIWDYQNNTVKGISLGGWFVLEPFITPSIFEQEQFGKNESLWPVDEFSLSVKLGKEKTKELLEKHWDSYYTEQDFVDIKNYGFNTVRIPVGYWAFNKLDNDPYVQGQVEYLDRAIEWARNLGLKVWVDLHGLPGSQNGFDNSGQRGEVNWLNDRMDPEFLEITYRTLYDIFGKYGGLNYTSVVTGIEIANEPMGPKLNITDLLDFTYNAYYDYREIHGSKNYFMVQEAFQPIGWWNDQLNNNYKNVSYEFTDQLDIDLTDNYFHDIILDHHHYEVFTDTQLAKTSDERIQAIRDYAGSIGTTQKYHKSLVGEWSAAITDCTKWLNGLGTGARYDGTFSVDQLVSSAEVIQREGFNLTDYDPNLYVSGGNMTSEEGNSAYNSTLVGGDMSQLGNTTAKFIWEGNSKNSNVTRTCSAVQKYEDFTDEHKAAIRKFIEIQLVEYELNSAGWIFWNYKTENAIEWDFKKLSEKGLFPSPFENYKYFFENGSEISTTVKNPKKNGSGSLYFLSSTPFSVTFLALTVTSFFV